MLPKRVWEWGSAQERAFKNLRDLLCSPPVLKLPDLQRCFIVDTDTCINATGAVSLQEYNDGLQPVAFHSAKCNPTERNYGTGNKELLAILQAFLKWHCYLK